MSKLAKIIRIITVAPIMALMLCTLLLTMRSDAFDNGIYMYFLCLLCLCIVPAIAYPIEGKWHIYNKLHPELNERAATRKLAIYTSVLGYAILAIVSFCTHQSMLVDEMILTYLISGILILISSMIIKVDASGHACGFIGPVVYLSYNISWWFLLMLPLYSLVIWSSLHLRRHTVSQIVLGSIIPVLSFIMSALIANISALCA